MKKVILLLLIIFFHSILISNAQNSWSQKADFDGITNVGRTAAAGFSIGSKGYIGTGVINLGTQVDFWEWDDSTNVWTQIANYGGGQRSNAVGFSIGNKGYVGTGVSNTGTIVQDFWEYEPFPINQWIQKTNVPGNVRYNAVGFSIVDFGYIGTGVGGTGSPFKDFYQYDPLGDSWSQRANFLGTARTAAIGFGIGNKGYIGTGFDSTGSRTSDFYEYDYLTDFWTQKLNFPGGGREFAFGFSIGKYGYIGAGSDGGTLQNDFWEWNQSNNTWVSRTPFLINVTDAVTFTICNKGYVGTGGVIGGETKVFGEYTPFSPIGAYFMISDDTICKSTCINFTDTSNNTPTSWHWDFGNGDTSILQNPMNICFMNAGNFNVTLSTLGNGCSSTLSKIVSVDSPSTSATQIASVNSVCFGQNISLTVSGGSLGTNANWYWYENICGSIPLGSGATLNTSVNQNTIFYVRAENNGVCPPTNCISKTVLVNMPPIVSISSVVDTVCIYNSPVNILGNPVGGLLLGTGVAGSSFNPVIAGVGVHQIVYSYTDSNTCSNSDTISIFVDLCLSSGFNNFNQNIFIFPNPAEKYINIIGQSNNIDNYTILEIYNSNGLKVLENKIINNVENRLIDVSELSKGIYFLKFISNTNIYTCRIMKI